MISKLFKFKCWHNAERDYDLVIDKGFLHVRITVNVPYKWVSITNKEEEEVISEVYNGPMLIIKLPKCKPGIYYFNFLVSDNGNTFEYYIGGKQIKLYYSDIYGFEFILPKYALWNRNLNRSGRLEYVLDNTLLPNEKTMSKFTSRIVNRIQGKREKIRAIHDFVARFLYYDWDSLRDGDTQRTIEQIVKTRRCVCQGYADLALLMYKSIGFEVQNILCYANGNIIKEGWSQPMHRFTDFYHIITRVHTGERWIYMDITWDSKNRFEDGLFKNGGAPSHTYFDPTLPFLSATHRFISNNQ